MDLDAESLQKQIPLYLTAEDQHSLIRDLKAIAGGAETNYFLSDYRNDFNEVMLQGDGWKGFQLFIFESGERRSIRGVVLSNSCDVDPKNPRELPARVIFAPLVKLAAYQAVLAQSGIDSARIEGKIAAIKAQKTTNVFYLPANGALTEDFVIRLDETHSMPVAAHLGSAEREKLFTLSNTGFYMLVLKLSVHFCRLQEKVNRKHTGAVA